MIADKPKKTRRLVAPRAKPANVPDLPTYTQAVAVRALSSGEATAEQQKIAFRWIVEGASGMYREAFDDSPRLTDFMLGRVFVGQQIVGVLKMNLSQLQKQEGRPANG